MTASNAWRKEFRTLMCDLAEHRLSPEDAAKLRERLAADPAARRQYVDFMMMLSNLYWIWGARAGNEHGRIGHKLEEVDGGGHAINSNPQSPGAPAPTSHAFSFNHLPQIFYSPALSYVFAALVLAIAVVAAHRWGAAVDSREGAHAAASAEQTPDVEYPLPEARANPLATAEQSGEKPPVFFGWITGTHGCKWSGSHTLDSCASAGQFFLDAGTLEVTYTNGVKVRVEGPAIYLLKSVNSAELRVGKVVVWSGRDGSGVGVHGSGLANQAPAAGNVTSLSPDPASRISHPLLFTVDTPNADLVGRDADFSVAVERLGACYTRVLRGTVGLTMPLCDPRELASLPAGAWAAVDRSSEGQPTLWVARDESGKVFAHKLPKGAPFLSGETGNKPRRKNGNMENRTRREDSPTS